jgi:UDP-glucose 4-epimerase
MHVLVTGSSGHLGEGLVRVLRRAKHQVTGIDVVKSEFTDMVGSIVHRYSARRAMQGVEAVNHILSGEDEKVWGS